MGAPGLRLAGGEPLLRGDLSRLVTRLAAIPGLDELALTTNGLMLEEQAADLAAAGLRRVTVSLDTLRRDRFEALTRRDGLEATLRGIEAARRHGLDQPLKLDTVVLRGENDDELLHLLAFAAEIDAEIRFIEYMDVGGATRWSEDRVVSQEAILATIGAAQGRPEPVAGRGSAPAARYRLPSGQIFGVIASTTVPFCGACDRARLTADGTLYHCLYGPRGLDLKAWLRDPEMDDETLRTRIAEAWRGRRDRGAEDRRRLPQRGALVPLEALRADPRLEMHTRGG